MTWIRADGPDNRELYVRANDIAEVELGGDEKAHFRRRGHISQYTVTDKTEVEKLLDLITKDEPPPQPVSVKVELAHPAPAPCATTAELHPAAVSPDGRARVELVLEALANDGMWRPQIRRALLDAGLPDRSVRNAVGVATRWGWVEEVEELVTLTAKGRAELLYFRKHGKLRGQ
jgi:hypothetical protein